MDSSSGRPQAGGQGVAGDSIVLEEEIDQNYVPSEVKPSSLFITVLDCSFIERFSSAAVELFASRVRS